MLNITEMTEISETTAEQSASALQRFKIVMDALEIPFCLFLGTALGAYRDQAFCPGDEDDMDVAVDIKYFPMLDKIIGNLCNPNLFQQHKDYIADDKVCPEIAFSMVYPGQNYSKIDIFFTQEINGQTAWRFYPVHDLNVNVTKLIDKRFLKTQDKIKFFGTEYNIPSHIEEYLAVNYGDWETPINRLNFCWTYGNKAPRL